MFTTLTTLLVTQVTHSSPVVIITGWDQPSSEQFRKLYKSFNDLPFTGTNVRALSSVEHPTLGTDLLANISSKGKWKIEWFTKAIEDFQAVSADGTRRLKDNYLIINTNPGDIDLMDEEGWQDILNHVQIAAQIAAKGKLRGISFDIEPYVKPFMQFNYASQKQTSKHTYEQYLLRSRELGKRFMKIIVAEFPTCELLNYHFLDSIDRGITPTGALSYNQGQWFDLFPAFVNGWYDAAPTGIRMIDGNEFAYHYNDPADYLAANQRIVHKNYQLLDPIHWNSYKRSVRPGHAFYLDSYVNPSTNEWYIDSKGTTPSNRLNINLQSALQSADFVWLYGEQAKWWSSGSAKENWQTKMPGLTELLTRTLNPRDYASKIIKDSSIPNIALNGTFDQDTENWSEWQDDQSKGTFLWQNGKAVMKGVKNGAYTQAFPCKPGDFFAASGEISNLGSGSGRCMIRWRTTDHKWTQMGYDLSFSQQNGKFLVYGQAPEGVGEVVLIPIGVSRGLPQDITTFDNIVVKHLTGILGK
jgi:hypothetical protein